MESTFSNIGIVIFNGLTNLDAVGPFEVLSRLPGVKMHLISNSMENIKTDRGIHICPTCSYDTCPELEVLVIPGGRGTQALLEDAATLQFIHSQVSHCKYVTSVCTGALVLGAAGLLVGKRATTHWAALDLLKCFGAIPTNERIVQEGNIITAAGVASGIDFALKLASLLQGEEVAKQIQLQIEYDPEPPFQSGSVKTASAELVQQVRNMTANPERVIVAKRVGAKLGFNVDSV